MDPVESMGWEGRRVWLQSSPTMPRVYGRIVHVSIDALHRDDLHIGVRLEDGAVTTAQGSHKGERWDFTD